MSYARADLQQALQGLKPLANFRQYVHTLEAHYNDRVNALLDAPMADEALRGECRALRNIIKNINKNTGELT